MTDAALGYEVAQHVATVTLNRPDAMNALDADLKVRLRDALRAAADDDGVRAVLLTGNGRAFCVGQDLVEHGAMLEATGKSDPTAVWTTVTEHYAPIVTALTTMPKPVVAGVNGIAAGAGAAFALACDFRVLADSAGFNFGFAAIGLSVDSGLSWTLPRFVGTGKAKELLLTPRTVGAEEARVLGLATSVVNADALLPSALAMARELARGPTAAYAAIRRSLAFSAAHGFEESVQFEAEMMQATGGTDDHRKAVQAFLGKRPATFEGH